VADVAAGGATENFFVIATGRQESVPLFIELTAKHLGWNAIT